MTKWAYVENNTIVGVYDRLPASWKHISGFNFLADDEPFLRSIGWSRVDTSNCVFDTNLYNECGLTYRLDGGIVFADPILVEKVVHVSTYSPIDEIRQQRDAMLKDSDVYQLADWQIAFTQELKTAWLLYRSKLRDIPQQFEELGYVVWPEELTSLIDQSRSQMREYVASLGQEGDINVTA